jgi:predicted O-methyltransferase YrrM
MILQPEKILEVGTAIGYSAILMNEATNGKSEIITIEKNEEMVIKAKENINKADLNDKIRIICGYAINVLESMNESFDMIFLDAAKSQYLYYLPHCLRMLKTRGLLICDNILYKGMIANNDLVKRRKITIVKRLRKFLFEINNNDQLQTSIIPISDGVSISVKKEVHG